MQPRAPGGGRDLGGRYDSICIVANTLEHVSTLYGTSSTHMRLILRSGACADSLSAAVGDPVTPPFHALLADRAPCDM